MLRTRLWMGTVLIVLAAGMLVLDQLLVPWYPFLFVFILGLALAACRELIGLLGSQRRLQQTTLFGGVILLISANWWLPWLVSPERLKASTWECLLGIFVTLMVVIFIWEMMSFRPLDEISSPGQGSVERMSRTLWALMYLGLMPCFLAQLRWLYPPNHPEAGSVALALVIFVPKFCDIGAYCFGRLLGRHRLTPVLSPKKTWEGALGGLAFGALTAIVIDRLGPIPVLHGKLGLEIGFGISLGIAGMLGDLAESLIKRDCRRKDASDAVPGFGGVLDVVDAVIIAAPLGYLELAVLA